MATSTLSRRAGRLLGLLAAGALTAGSIVAVAPAVHAAPVTGSITVAAKAKKLAVPKKKHLSYSLASKRYTGKAQKVSVKAKVKGLGKITVYYQGTSGTTYKKSKTAPKKIGSYKVSVKIAKGKKYRAATVKLGTVKIVREWKVTFNANGGKIGSSATKKVYVTNSAKLGKLPSATRSGYTFQGWYTKKSGGSKISTSTKATKNITYYARWKAKAPIDANLVGTWTWVTSGGLIAYYFYPNGSYKTLLLADYQWFDVCIYGRGDWSASAGVLKLSNRKIQSAESATCATDNVATIKWGPWNPATPPSQTEYYAIGSDGLGTYAHFEDEPIQNGQEYSKFRYEP